jgi:hypothetical protein
MIGVVEEWLGVWAPSVSRMQPDSSLSGGLGHSKAQETIGYLTKQAVREGKNKRQGEDPDAGGGGYSGGYSTGRQTGGSYGGDSIQQSRTNSLL